MEQEMFRVIEAVCQDVCTPRALAVKLLAQYGEWSQLGQLRVEPHRYRDAESYFKDCLVTDLLRKCNLPSGVDKARVARDTFFACEKQNARTNARLSRFMKDSLLIEDSDDDRVYRFIGDWRKEVRMVIGCLPDTLPLRFSGGATFADTGSLTTIPDKMSSVPTITEGARCLLPFWVETSWFRALSERSHSDPRTVRGNIFFTVPKDGNTDRGCCKEPSLNISFQLSAGKLISKRLSRVGVDLLTAQDRHRLLAKEASITGALCTIDMSNASDTVCRVLPHLVLPGDWAMLLESLRSTHTRVEGKWVRLEKFSSMGNGFTFELETLLFVTMARTIVAQAGGDPDLVSCYGDDLIAPSEYYREIVAALRFFGFDPNMKKTFAEGPFRESCGGDFWEGVPVRALFLKELPNEPQQWISLANGLRRVAGTNNCTNPRWALVQRAWLRALSAIPSPIRRCRGPEHLGDIVIHDDPAYWSVCELHKKKHPSWEAGFIKAYLPVPSTLPWSHWRPAVQLASCTLGLPSTGVTPRGAVSGYRIGVVVANLTSSWLPTPQYLH